jgi:hypothetical protein
MKIDELIKQISENISGIWVNQKYELLLGLNNVFAFEEKSGDIIDGTYSIIQPAEGQYPTLRLTEPNGMNHDYVITELTVFETLTISHEGERIHLKNLPPDEYEGEVINPANN